MDPIEERRERCRTDLLYLGKCLGYDFQPDVHQPLFDLLLKFKTGAALRDLSEIKNRLILWPRGHFKSSVMACFIVQLILNYPDIRVLIMQGNLKLTKLWLKEIKSHFLSPGSKGANTKSALPTLFPEFCAPVLGNNMEFTSPARQRMHLPAATVTVASPKAVSTGQHYDVFFPDDLVNQQNYRNIELLDKLMEDFDLFTPLIDPGGYTFMTGTRYHHADIYGRVIRRNQGEWVISIRAASLTGKWPVVDDNELLFPTRVTADGRKIGFTKEILLKIAQDSPEMFWAQYMNRIVAAGRQIFTEPMILGAVRNSQDKDLPQTPTVFFIDLAESKRADADHSVIAAGRRSGNTVWIIDCVGSTFSTYELALTLIVMTLKHRPIKIIVAKEPGAVHFVEYAKVLAREKGIILPIMLQEKASRHKDAKAMRIGALESRLRNKQLFFAAGIPDFQRLIDEFTQFPKGEHDDRPDAIAMLVEWFAQAFVEVPRGPQLPWFVTQQSPSVPSEDVGDSLLGSVLD